MSNSTKYLVVAVALLLLAAGPALAQTATGGLRGSVVDEKGQVLWSRGR